MKRGLLITGIILGAAIVFVAGMLVAGPLVSHSFSTINAPLNYAFDQNIMSGSGGSPMPGLPAPTINYDATLQNESYGQRAAVVAAVPAGNSDGSTPNQPTLVIKNADLTIVVKDPTAKMDAIAGMAEGMGGRLVSSNLSETYTPDGTKVPQGTIVVRVPAAKLDDALKEIKSNVIEVQNENRSSQDVTKEYIDLQSQLDNLNATEQQLTLIMQKADKTTDVLDVFNQLTQIRGQIDVIKGQMQYYQQSAALSAISVNLVAQQSTQPITVAGWEPQGQARDAIQALVNFFQGFVNFLIWLVLLVIPALVLIALPIFLIFLLVRAILRRRQAKKPTVVE